VYSRLWFDIIRRYDCACDISYSISRVGVYSGSTSIMVSRTKQNRGRVSRATESQSRKRTTKDLNIHIHVLKWPHL